MAQRGYHVLAGVRREQDANELRGPNIEPVMLDVTRQSDVAAVAERISNDPRARPLRALVNNAGIGANAPVEVFGLDAWRHLFEVNYFGHIAITQKLLPSLFESKGRVVNISSVGGRLAMATYGPYGGTKFALEALSDSLRREVAPLGVKVIVIEPGAVQTRISASAIATAREVQSQMTPEQCNRYGALIHAVTAQAASADKTGTKASVAARVIAKAITVESPRARYGVGREAALLGVLRFLPDSLVDRLLGVALRPYLPK